LHKSKPEPSEPVRWVEVFTGAGRRRRWTAEQKALIVAESYESAPVSAVARRHGLTPQQLFGWRRKARRDADDRADTSGVAFVPVLVEPAANTPIRAGSAAIIEIVIGAAMVRVARGIDGATLTTVLRAVKAAT
jgi:transposase